MNLKMKKDIVYWLLFLFLFVLMTQDGIVKYLVLSGLIVVFFLLKRRINLGYFLVSVHAVVYVVWGLVVAVLSNNISFNSIKQTLIFLSSAFLSVAIFSVYGKENSKRLVDIQFIALCVAYLLMFAQYFTLDAFYYESCFYAYIFGVYILVYFMRKKYIHMAVAIVFMGFEHKRIVDAAAILAFMCMLIILMSPKERFQKGVNRLALAALIVMPMLWVVFCSNGLLKTVFASLGINTMGRLEGTGAWNIARDYYEMSPFYFGKGSGWVINWLESANIPAFSNLHNDVLTAYMELGFVGFCVWLISFQYILLKIKKIKGVHIANIVALLIGFMFINLLTDNIYLYVTFLVPFYIVLLNIIFGEESKLNTKGKLVG